MYLMPIAELERAIKDARNGDEIAQDKKLALIARMEAERGKRPTAMIIAQIERYA